MKATIYKYPLVDGLPSSELAPGGSTVDFVIQMPRDAKPLALQAQGSVLTLWALTPKIETGTPMVERRFFLVGTGWAFEHLSSMTYIGTAQIGGLVWHVFERGRL